MLLLAFASPLSSCDSWLETCLLSADACAALPASCGSCATCVAAKPAAKPAAAKPAPTPAPTPAAEVATRHPAERKDKKSALLEMNTGRPTGDLVAAPAAVVAKFLLEYARRAGACPPGSAFERAEEDAVVSAAERSVFTTEAAAAKRGGYSESLFDDFVRI